MPLAYKYRLYPNNEQQGKLWKHANKLNWLYNYFLNQRIESYKENKITINKKQQQAELVKLKLKDKLLQEIHSQVLQQVTNRLDKTYQAFFKNYKLGQGFPKFRGCYKFFGICYPQKGFSIENDKFITKVYGKIGFIKHRDIKGNIKQVMITVRNNKWFLIVTTDYERIKYGNGVVGIDVGITNLASCSDNIVIKNVSHTKYFDKKINELKSGRDVKTKRGSRRYKFLSNVIQRLYGAKDRKINDFLHKVSYNLSSRYNTIIVEDLLLKEMSEGYITGLNRELRNSQLAKFISYLDYKTNYVLKVNPRNTSKTCNRCGKVHNMPLWKRDLVCDCGNKDDRDINAAKNIYCLGQAYLKTGRTVEIQEAIAFRQW